jgi:hypothetical protein
MRFLRTSLNGCLAAACLSLPVSSEPQPRRVLFIGNSLTTVNNVPDLVARLAAAAGQPFQHRTVAFDGYSLEDHWNRGDARRAIAEGGWSIVVLQQGPSALPESRALLRDYVRRFDGDARRIGARTALYMVWPAADRRGDFADVKLSYRTAAHDIDGLFIPGGEAWLEAWRHDQRLELYGSDGFHPTPAGSYLVALVMFDVLFARRPIGLPSLVAPAHRAELLQRVAADVVERLRHR